MNSFHFLSAKQSYTAQRGQRGRVLQAVRGSLLHIDFLPSKMKTLPLHLDCRVGALRSSRCTPPASQHCTPGECTTAPSQLLRSSPGRSGHGKQCTPGILPDMGIACGQCISHIPWDRHNRESAHPATVVVPLWLWYPRYP